MEQISNKLLVKYLQNKCTLEEVLLIETWIQQDIQNKFEFIEFKKAWKTSLLANDFDKIDERKAWENINVQLKRERKFNFKQLFGAVAAIALLFYLVYNPNNFDFNFFKSNQTTFVAHQNNASCVLPDGSKVWLYKGSILKYPKKFDEKHRNVSLTGQAYFKVTKKPHKPFHIDLRNTQTTVLGTEFNLNGLADDIELVLTEGSVQFSSPNQTMLLKPNEKIVCNALGNLTKTTNLDLNYNAWKTSILKFNNTLLSKAIKDINTVYHTNITLDGTALNNNKLTIEFNNEKLENILNTLEILYNLKISYLPKNQITLSIP